MRPAAERLARALREVAIRAPAVPFASNVTGALSSDPEAIRRQLADQVCASVLWEKSMRHALALGIREFIALASGIKTFLEPAPGEVLGGILRKIDESASVTAVARPEQVPA